MPKETIYDEASMYDMEIGWARENVQVGLVTRERIPIVQQLAKDAGDPAMFTSLWGTLDRAGCNRMIKMLRKARDEAFGRDE